MNDDELMHYGVLGMKLGVRRNPSKAFSKAIRKADKLNENIDRAQTKVEKKTAKRDKVAKRYAGWGFAGRGDVAAATQRLYKAEKKLKKKRTKRAQKWRSNMQKTFADVDVKSIDSEVLSRGREYIDMLKK